MREHVLTAKVGQLSRITPLGGANANEALYGWREGR